MKRILCLLLVVALLIAASVGCSQEKAENPMTEVKVTLPFATGTRAIVEGEAVITTQLYLLARAYIEKLETYDTETFDAAQYSQLLARTQEAVRLAEVFCDTLERHAEGLEQIEEMASTSQEKASYELLSASGQDAQEPSLIAVAHAASTESPAVRYAKELTAAFDTAKNGQKLKAVAEKYGTDVKKAKVMLEQAQAVLAGAAYEDQAAFENSCYELAVETKAAASVLGFGVAVVASGGIAAGGVSAAGIVEAGGLVCNGLQAIIDTGTAATIHITNGEGNEDTMLFEKADEALSGVSTFFAIGGGVQNVLDFRNPEKALQKVDNAAQAFLTGVGLARDYVQDGKVLGISANIADGYREVFFREADASDKEAVTEVLTKTGVSEEALENATATSGQSEPAGELGTAADAYIAAFEEVTDPENPVDAEAFLAPVEAAFAEEAVSEGASIADLPEDSPEADIAEAAEPDESADAFDGNPLAASHVAGVYHFEGVNASIAATDDTHMTVTDMTYNEIISGTYDEASGTFTAELSEDMAWYVTIVFTDTENGIQADYKNTIGGNIASASSAMKEASDTKGGLPASEVAGTYAFQGDSVWTQIVTVNDQSHLSFTDAEDPEAVIIGSYDENTGIFTYCESGDSYTSSVTVTFADTGSGIRADMLLTLSAESGSQQAAFSAMKQ